VDAQGRVVAEHVGEISAGTLKELIDAANR
jgi:hypothetical protein